MSKSKSKTCTPTNDVWQHILEHNSINYSDDEFNEIITSEQIKDSKSTYKVKKCQFEPRLLTQVNTEHKYSVLKDNNISIISLGGKPTNYLLTKGIVKSELDYNYDSKDVISLNSQTDSVLLPLGSSETSALDNLRYSGMYEHIVGEPIKYDNLLSGRHYMSMSARIIKKLKRVFNVDKAQFEIDACYETEKYVIHMEAKSSKIEEFNLRQIYFPYRYIYDKIDNKKEIISLFMCPDKNKLYHVWQYKFDKPKRMFSAKVVNHWIFKLE